LCGYWNHLEELQADFQRGRTSSNPGKKLEHVLKVSWPIYMEGRLGQIKTAIQLLEYHEASCLFVCFADGRYKPTALMVMKFTLGNSLAQTALVYIESVWRTWKLRPAVYFGPANTRIRVKVICWRTLDQLLITSLSKGIWYGNVVARYNFRWKDNPVKSGKFARDVARSGSGSTNQKTCRKWAVCGALYSYTWGVGRRDFLVD
jgi:hypothetical protein